MTHYIEAPLVNVNDDIATITVWVKPEGSPVNKGEVIAVLETTKATFDLESDHTGYLRIFAAPGAQVKVGELIGAICDTPDEKPHKAETAQAPAAGAANLGRLTKKAEIAARKAGLDTEKLRAAFSGTETITESDVNTYAQQRVNATLGAGASNVTDTVDDVYAGNRQQRLLIIGGGLGAVQLLDSLSRTEAQRATAIVDDNRELRGKTVMGIPIVGGQEMIETLFKQKAFDAAVVSVSTSISFRRLMFEKLAKLNIPGANVVDVSARIQRNAVLGLGNVILAYCQIGSCAVVGNGNFLSAYVDIEHHCAVGDFCTFGPGVMASALVRVGNGVKFGTGIFIEPKIMIGADSIIGSGAIVTRNIPQNSIAKTRVTYTIRPRNERTAFLRLR